VIGQQDFYPHYGPIDEFMNDGRRALDGFEAIYAYLYYDLAPVCELNLARDIASGETADILNLSTAPSQSTLNRLPGSMPESARRFYASEAETLVRQWQETKFENWVRDPIPETIAPDGEGIPPVQTQARLLRNRTFPFLQLDRDESVEYSKDALYRLLVTAANGAQFVNDAAKNLDLKSFYDGSEVPTRQILEFHIRKATREQITQMFIHANDELFQIADENGYFEGENEVAIDITDWQFYGDADASKYVSGTKPGRNFSYSFKFVSLSLVGTDSPLTLLALPLRTLKNKAYAIRRMLRLTNQYIDIERAYLDSGFYSEKVARTLGEFGVEFVMQGKRSGDAVKQLLQQALDSEEDMARTRYGVGDIPNTRHHLFCVPSKKTSSRRKSDDYDPADDYTVHYTNAPLSESDPMQLDDDYRRRWGIETGYRVIKNSFLAKSRSRNLRVRLYRETARVPRGLTPRVNHVSYMTHPTILIGIVATWIKDLNPKQLRGVARKCDTSQHPATAGATGAVGRGGVADPHGRTERSGGNSSRPISGRSRGITFAYGGTTRFGTCGQNGEASGLVPEVLHYFNFTCHLYNLWTVANALRADEIGHDLSEDGKVFTANRLLQSIEDDPYDMTVANEVDISERENVLRHSFW